MPKITDEELEAKVVMFFKSDLDWLRQLYHGNFGVNRAVRNIVRAYIVHAKAKADAEIDAQEAKPQAELME